MLVLREDLEDAARDPNAALDMPVVLDQ